VDGEGGSRPTMVSASTTRATGGGRYGLAMTEASAESHLTNEQRHIP
jgi:hypothetical protein